LHSRRACASIPVPGLLLLSEIVQPPTALAIGGYMVF